MSTLKLPAANGGGSISIKGPSTAGSDTDFLDTSGNLKVTGNTTVDGKILLGTTTEGASGADELTINTSSDHGGMTIRTANDKNGNIWFSDGTSGAAEYAGYIQYAHDGDRMVLGVNGSERLRIDSSGNVGIGKTPANYHSNNKGVIAGDGGYAILGRSDNALYITQNHYYDGSDNGRYIVTGEASLYGQVDGTHQFYVAASGSADAGTTLAKALDVKNNKNVEVTDGNLVIGTAGHGIDFSATYDGTGSGTSTTSELFDDYEEGTWTPGASHDSLSYAAGTYTRIGRMVYAAFEVTFGSSSTASHQSLTGMPWNATSNNCGVAQGYNNNSTDKIIYHISTGENKIYFYQGSGTVLNANATSSTNFRGVAIYQA